MNLEELSKIPITEIEKYVDIKRRKNDYVRTQNYYDALILREEEKMFINKYPILDTIFDYENIVSNLRERKINEILQEKIKKV